MLEAVHGSAPRMIEEGIGEYANPASILKAAEMLLRHIGYIPEADRLAAAMRICTGDAAALRVTGDRDGAKCAEFADYLLETLAAL